MSLIARIRADLNAARKERKDPDKVKLLSTLAGEAERVGKDSGNRETTDPEAVGVVRKFIKNAEMTAAELTKAGRDDSAVRREIEILEAYLPAGVPESEVEAAAREIAAGLPDPKAKSAFGMVVKGLKERFGESFDGGAMAPVVKRVMEEG